ncbi:linker for activation of T-cells family member 2 [Dryobates pubescens]|uniref:linker for activation of T-cells family member 2 n=1 Tax=Dryobates pubescens TaxID=118200 RepID=UPI0023B8DD48|nr:linker for activation of T-cells family member 2 [Dryobates pubescens]
MAQMELLWAAAVLMLLGAAISLCVKCQLSASKREKQLSKQRSQLESQRRFEVIRNHSRSKTKTRYQNFLTEDRLQGDAVYVEPISLDYYNYARFFTPPYEKEEDSHSYQNVIIGVSRGSDPEKEEDSHSYQNVIIGVSRGSDPDDAEDYKNSTAIHMWKLQQAKALRAESSDEEPDYVNTAPVSGPPPLSKQRSSGCDYVPSVLQKRICSKLELKAATETVEATSSR